MTTNCTNFLCFHFHLSARKLIFFVFDRIISRFFDGTAFVWTGWVWIEVIKCNRWLWYMQPAWAHTFTSHTFALILNQMKMKYKIYVFQHAYNGMCGVSVMYCLCTCLFSLVFLSIVSSFWIWLCAVCCVRASTISARELPTT